MPTSRLEAFSDGVMAVAITLLVLDLPVRGPSAGSLGGQLHHEWGSFAAFAVSFFVIGIVWVNHHALFAGLARVDRLTQFLNLVLLLFVTLIPFVTATLARYLSRGGGDSHLAAALYGLVGEGMALSFASIFAWSLRAGQLATAPSPAAARRALFRFGIGTAVYLVAIGVAFVNAAASLLVEALIAAYYVFDQLASGPDGNEAATAQRGSSPDPSGT